MKEIKIFEPAMCCETGLCGVSVDPELLRITTLLSTLKENNIEVGRFNLSSAPQAFVDDKEVNEFINKYGTDNLPVTEVDGKIEVVGRYPSNEEFAKWLEISPVPWNGSNNVPDKSSDGGCCSGGGCC